MDNFNAVDCNDRDSANYNTRQVSTQIDITYESSVGCLIEWYMYATWLLFGVE